MHVAIAALLCLSFSFALPARAADSARSYSTGASIAGAEAIRIQWNSPRMAPAEFAKVVADAGLRSALNQNHLSGIGRLELLRAARIGNEFLDAGTYAVSIAIGDSGSIALRLSNGSTNASISLAPAPSASASPHIAIAVVPGEPIETFGIEVRFGSLAGIAPAEFGVKQLIADLNNRAFDLLTAKDQQQRDPRTALVLASRANTLTSGKNPLILDTLALAYYRNGKPANAVDAQRLAIQLLDPGQDQQKAGMQQRLEAFIAAAKQPAKGN